MVPLLRYIDILLGRILYSIFNQAPFLNKSADNINGAVKKILLIKLWGIGNLTIIWPLIHKIREAYPDSHIFFLTFDLNRAFMEKNRCIDKIIYFRFTKNIFIIIINYFRALVKLRVERLDLVINFETFNNASSLFSFLTNAHIRLGINNKYEKIFYNHWVNNSPDLHISQIYTNLLKLLPINFDYNYFYFSKSKENDRKIAGLLQDLKIDRFICIHPGTSENFKGKRWPWFNFSELSNLMLQRYNIPLIFTGTELEKRTVANIIKKIKPKDKIFNFVGHLNIWEYVELIRRSFLFISNDTGPAHLAASLGINTVIFYGPTSPLRYRPLTKNSVIYYKNLKCGPCVGSNYLNKKCRNKFKCLDFTPKEIVLKISEKFFNEK
ncbi:MAG: glycosyltransferase family 9 protein [Candidatus Omnitrophota bacterium]